MCDLGKTFTFEINMSPIIFACYNFSVVNGTVGERPIVYIFTGTTFIDKEYSRYPDDNTSESKNIPKVSSGNALFFQRVKHFYYELFYLLLSNFAFHDYQ